MKRYSLVDLYGCHLELQVVKQVVTEYEWSYEQASLSFIVMALVTTAIVYCGMKR